jgi:formyltetrahydrofolate deformylase
MTRELTEITVIGGDKKGLIAQVTTLLFERGINIEDVDQAVRDGLFRMTLHVDTSEMVVTPDTLRGALHDLGDELDVDIQVRFPSDRETQQIAVLVTKESHCLEALFEAWANDDLDAEISVVVGNHDDLEPLARQYDVPFHDIGDEKGSPDESELLDILGEYDADLVVLARYMRILSPNVVFRYEGRIINIHPSLLPSFPGAAAYRQAKEEGVRIGGVTAHYVTTDLDQGPIIAQRAFNIPDDASLDRIKELGQPLEASALLEAVRLHLDDAVSVHRGRTSLREETDADDYQLGLPPEIESATPDRPIDGLGEAVRDAAADADAAEAKDELVVEPDD